jgi:hypothetical protein
VARARKPKKSKKRKFREIGRDAGTGRFKSVRAARKDREGSIVQRIRNRGRRKKKRS